MFPGKLSLGRVIKNIGKIIYGYRAVFRLDLAGISAVYFIISGNPEDSQAPRTTTLVSLGELNLSSNYYLSYHIKIITS